MRAATPTAAAELALPDIYSLNMHLSNMEKNIRFAIENNIAINQNKLLLIEKSDGFNSVKNKISGSRTALDNLKNKMSAALSSRISYMEQTVKAKTEILENLSPVNNLKRGYALIYKENLSVKQYDFTVGETAKIVTFSQELDCEIKSVKPRKV